MVTYPNVNLKDKIAPIITSVASTNVMDCGLSDGTITITATSIQGSVEYSIDGGTTYQPSNVFSSLAAGTYQIRVRNIDGTCEVSDTDITITEPVQPAITNVASTDPSNCGVSDGTITVTATGSSIEYSIDGGTNWQATGSFTSLAPGTYNVAVRNTDGTCFVLNTNNPVILTAPNAPSITNVASTNPTDCSVTDGMITVTATGGSGSFEYSNDGGISWQVSNVFNTLSGGTYPIRVRNLADGSCEVTYPDVILIDKVAPVIASVNSTNVTDCGLTDGTITVTASSTQGTVEYSINGGTSWSQSGIFSALTAGTYQIRVRNIDGTCVVSATDVVITAPTAPVITNVASTNPSNCGVNDGTITVTATAGSAATQYSIDGGTNWVNSGTFTSLAAGTYNIIVRNTGNTCVVPYTSNPVILTAPNAPSITNVVSTNPTDCGVADGTITITTQGGNGPLQYSIDGGTNWQTSGNFTGLDGDTYEIRVSNAGASNPCTVTYPDVTLIDKIAPVIASVASTNVTDCGLTDGTITITATSAQGSVEYSIDGGTTYQPSNVFTALTAGTYQIRVRNIDGTCVQSSTNITITTPTAPAITTVAPTNPSDCGINDGAIVVTATAGSAAAEYSIDGGTNWQSSNTFNGLAAGTYNVFVRNTGNTCTIAYASNPVILSAPNAPTITADVDSAVPIIITGTSEVYSRVTVEIDFNKDGVKDATYETSTRGASESWSVNLQNETPISGSSLVDEIPSSGDVWDVKSYSSDSSQNTSTTTKQSVSFTEYINNNFTIKSTTTEIHAGKGFDTVKLSGDIDLDLTDIFETRLFNVEHIDLTDFGNNTLTVNETGILNISNITDTLLVSGNVGDALIFQSNSNNKDWVSTGYTQIIDEQNYLEYAAGIATILVDNEVQVII